MPEQRLEDTDRTVEMQHTETVFQGAIWDIQRDTFRLGGSDHALTREYLSHPGAVAIVALDDQRRVALINQYRHPVRQDCWEIPAGLMDTSGEDPLTTAQRELAEETDLRANKWSVLVDHYPSAGSSSEALRIFLAQGIEEIPDRQRHQREAEEAQIILRWVPFDQALQAVLNGAVRNVNAVSGLMATHFILDGQYQARPAETPF